MTFPTSLRAFLRQFPDEASCRGDLVSRRWPTGATCSCGTALTGAVATRDLLRCPGCRRQWSSTAGTVLHHSHLPLTAWFAAAYLVVTTRGVNAIELGALLGIANQETTWAMLARFRAAMAASLTGTLGPDVEVDEAFYGGVMVKVRGRQLAGSNKRLVLVLGERGSGRCRMVPIPDARADTLEPVIMRLVAPGSTITTDGHRGYQRLPSLGFRWNRIPHPPGGMRPGSPHSTPLVDGLIAASKSWLRETYHKPPADLAPYLAEFCFRREFAARPEDAFTALLVSPAPLRRVASSPTIVP